MRATGAAAGQPAVEDFAAVYDRHRGHVYAMCMRRLRSAADADDATQVTFLRAWSAMQRGNGPRLGAGPWLSVIARNVCADRLADPRQAVPVDTTELTIVDDGPPPDEGVLAESDGAEVRAALAHLPFAQRSALHLREVEELPYVDIGERLALPLTAVETLLFRARGNLRDELEAVRDPVGCEQARTLATMVRDGLTVAAGQRKRLRNHRSDCAHCARLPVRRARSLAGARAAAVMAATGLGVALRRLIVTPTAEAMASASVPAKTAAVVITASTAAVGGVAIERPATERPAPRTTAAAPRSHSAPASRRTGLPVVLASASVPHARLTTASLPARSIAAGRPARGAAVNAVGHGSGGQVDPALDHGSSEPGARNGTGGHADGMDGSGGSQPPAQTHPVADPTGGPQSQSPSPSSAPRQDATAPSAMQAAVPPTAEQTRPDRGADGPGAR